MRSNSVFYVITVKMLYFFIVINSTTAVAQRPFSDIRNSGVLIKVGDSYGSGFFFQSKSNLFLITAKHVILDESTKEFYGKEIEITHYSSVYAKSLDSIQSNKIVFNVDSIKKNKDWVVSPERDIIALRIATVYDTKSESDTNANKTQILNSTKIDFGGGVFNTHVEGQTISFRKVEVATSVTIVGFPTSLDASKFLKVSQYDFKTPLLRQGIVAGKNYTRKLIVLDCPVYYGNSGGPAFVSDIDTGGVRLIGVVTEYIPLIDVWKNTRNSLSHIYTENSGYSIVEPIDEIIKVIHQF